MRIILYFLINERIDYMHKPHFCPKGFLIDLDGVLYIGDKIIDGAIEIINQIKSQSIPCRFVTNTTTKSCDTLYKHLQQFSLPIEKHEIITAPRAAALHLESIGSPICFLCMNNDVKCDFVQFDTSETDPEVIVVGDIDDQWDYDIMNRLFRMAIGRAEIVALHKGRYWEESDGLKLDIGAFVAGLEYASGKTATVIGKPNQEFFLTAVADLGLQPQDVAMIGDDIESDIGGAQEAGLKGILVRTGKYRNELADRSHVQPYAIIDSIAGLDIFFKS
jgi:HAD superfamily hydrolase (TIGR01458 family)